MTGVNALIGISSGPSNFNLAVSKIETTSPNPYLEVRSIIFQATTYGPTPFLWLWISSSLDQPPVLFQSKPITEVVENKTVVVAQTFNRQESYPAENGAYSPHWALMVRNDYTYAFGFLIAFNDSITFDQAAVYASFYPPDLGDQWIHNEAVQRFDSQPNNETLSYWGLRPADLVGFKKTFKTFYLYEFTFSRTGLFVERLNLTYRLPSEGLFVVLLASGFVLIFRKFTLTEALTIYLGTAFFSISFLLSFAQLGFGPISQTESLLYIDIYGAIILSASAILLRLAGKNDTESSIQFYRRFRETHSNTAVEGS